MYEPNDNTDLKKIMKMIQINKQLSHVLGLEELTVKMSILSKKSITNGILSHKWYLSINKWYFSQTWNKYS